MKYIILGATILLSFSVRSQQASYTLQPLKAVYVDSTDPKEIILIFQYATKSGQEEKLIISGKITYNVNGGPEKAEVLGKNNRHTIAIHDKNIISRAPELFSLIKDEVDANTDQFKLLVFYLRGIADQDIQKMTFTYGLWEPAKEDVRVETKYELNVNKIPAPRQ